MITTLPNKPLFKILCIVVLFLFINTSFSYSSENSTRNDSTYTDTLFIDDNGETEDPVITIAPLLAYLLWCLGYGALIHGGRYVVECLLYGGFNVPDLIGHLAAGALWGIVGGILLIYAPLTVFTVWEVAGHSGLVDVFGDIFGDFFEMVFNWIVDVWDFLTCNVEEVFNENDDQFESILTPYIHDLDNVEGGRPGVPGFEAMWADFSGPEIEVENLELLLQDMAYNDNYGIWRMETPGSSSLVATFNLQAVPDDLMLSLTHLSSADEDAPNGGYSPVDIFINGNLFLDNYDVAENHEYSHSYFTDEWEISDYLVPGQNQITIELEDDPLAYTHYWIHNLSIIPGFMDIEAPLVELSSPNDGGTYSGLINIVADASDNNFVEKVKFEYSLNHQHWYNLIGPDSPNGYDINGDDGWSLRFDTEAAGIYFNESILIRVKSFDSVENESEWDECDQPLAVNNLSNFALSNPSIDPSGGSPSTVFTFSVLYTSINPEDPDYVRVYIDNTPYELSTSDYDYNDGSVFNRSGSGFSAGTHVYYYKARLGSNIQETDLQTFFVSDPSEGHNYSITNFDSPSRINPGISFNAIAHIKNNGDYSETDIPILWELRDHNGTLRDNAIDYSTLDPDENESFSQWFNTSEDWPDEEYYTLTVYAQLLEDEHPGDNYWTKTIWFGEAQHYARYRLYPEIYVITYNPVDINSEICGDPQFGSECPGGGYCVHLRRILNSGDMAEVDVSRFSHDFCDRRVWLDIERIDDENLFDNDSLLVVYLGGDSEPEYDAGLFETGTGHEGDDIKIDPSRVVADAGSIASFMVYTTEPENNPYFMLYYTQDSEIVQAWDRDIEVVSEDQTDFRVDINVPLSAQRREYECWAEFESNDDFLSKLEIIVHEPHNISITQLLPAENSHHTIGEVVEISTTLYNPGGYDESNVSVIISIAGPNSYEWSQTITGVDIVRGNSVDTSVQWPTYSIDSGTYNINAEAIITGDAYPTNNIINHNIIIDPCPTPPPPSLINPSDGEIDLTIPITFNWSDVPNTDYYHYQISTDSLFSYSIASIETTATEIAIDNLYLNNSYFWRVRSHNFCGNYSNWSEIWNFSTQRTIPKTIYVSADGDDISGNGSLENPFLTIQHGIDRSIHGDTLLVLAGTYIENINYSGKNIFLTSNFINTGDTLDIHNTIIDGDSSDLVVSFYQDEDTSAVLNGFTIQNGYSNVYGGGIYCESNVTIINNIITGNSTGDNGGGGGIFCSNSSPKITNNLIKNNFTRTGGGIYCSYSNPIISNNRIIENTATSGAGIGIRNSSPMIQNNTISNNVAEVHCGGIHCYDSSPIILNNIIEENSGNSGGGIHCRGSFAKILNNKICRNIGSNGSGIYLSISSDTISHNLIYENQAEWHGGGIYCWDASPIINNNSICGNSAVRGGGLYCRDNANPFIVNTVFWADSAAIEGNEIYIENDPLIISFCNIQDSLWPGEGNISCDPMFCDTTSNNYFIDALSCCAGTGENGDNIGALGIGCTSNNLPNLFDLYSPGSGDTVWNSLVSFSWYESSDPDPGDSVLYSWYCDTLFDLSTAIIIDEIQATILVVPLPNWAEDHYLYWTVKASDSHDGYTFANDTLDFFWYLPESPEVFDLASPSDGAILNESEVAVSWHPSSDPDPGDSLYYRVYWSEDQQFNNAEIDSTVDTTYVISDIQSLFSGGSGKSNKSQKQTGGTLLDLPDDIHVYWRVEVVDRFGNTSWCEPDSGWSFSIYLYDAPGPFSLMLPADGDTVWGLSTELVWESSENLDPGDSIWYGIYYDTLTDLSTADTVLDIVDTTITISELLYDYQYWWTVKAFDTNTPGTMASDTLDFYTYFPEPPNTIQDLTAFPGNNRGAIELSWTAPGAHGDFGSASYYDIRYNEQMIDSNNWDSSTPVMNPPQPSPAGTTEQFTVEGLSEGEVYFMGIKACNGAHNCSEISNIAVSYASGIMTPTPINTIEDTLNLSVNVFCSIVESYYNIYYVFALDTSRSFSNPLIEVDLIPDSLASAVFSDLSNYRYFWRCCGIASDESDSSQWSTYVTFTFGQDSNDYLPGDASMYNGQWPPLVIGGDVTYMVNYFRGITSNPPCLLEGFWCSADANGDCMVIGSDVTKLVNYFRGIVNLQYCSDYEPTWPIPDDLPAEAPSSWPNCKVVTSGGGVCRLELGSKTGDGSLNLIIPKPSHQIFTDLSKRL